MGEPAELSREDEEAALLLARHIVGSVRGDAAFPIPFLTDTDRMRLLQLAQLVLKLRRITHNI